MKSLLPLLFLFPVLAWAEKAPASAESLKKEATHILVGTVTGFQQAKAKSRHQGLGASDWDYTITFQVDAVEKGEGFKLGETATVKTWRVRKAGLFPMPAPSGHYGKLPAKGQRARFHAVARKVEGSTEYWLIYPNGAQVLEAE